MEPLPPSAQSQAVNGGLTRSAASAISEQLGKMLGAIERRCPAGSGDELAPCQHSGAKFSKERSLSLQSIDRVPVFRAACWLEKPIVAGRNFACANLPDRKCSITVSAGLRNNDLCRPLETFKSFEGRCNVLRLLACVSEAAANL